jgi:hypothetical protein
MTGKVNQRSAQWIEGGVTTIVVSGLLTISWRVYTVGKIPFWSAWPGILGVAVVGVGLIMLVVGAALRENEERPESSKVVAWRYRHTVAGLGRTPPMAGRFSATGTCPRRVCACAI